ncbi:MAG: hypothetical protein QXR85_02425 [Candidatus Micrarchaeaceae archaeon]
MDEKPIAISKKKAIMVYAVAIAVLLVTAAAIQLSISAYTPLDRCESIAVISNKYDCIKGLAVSTANTSMCSTIPSEYATGCYSAIAENTANASLCRKITNTSSEYQCISYVAERNGNSTLCNTEQEPYKGACYQVLAEKYANASMCAYAANQTGDEICISEIMSKRAFATDNVAYCSNVSSSLNSTVVDTIVLNVSNADLENVTLFLVGYAAKSTGQIAQQPVSAYSAKDFCVIGVAYASDNATACKYAEPALQPSCLEILSLKHSANITTSNFTQELQSCSTMGSYETICTQSVLIAEAIKTNNGSICTSLGTAESTCYSALAEYTKNASMCLKISNSTSANACSLAISLNETG